MGLTRKQILNLLFDAYKTGSNVSVETIAAYNSLLADMPTVVLKAGIVKSIKNCKFLPTIAEIRYHSQNFVGDVTGEKIKDYAEAWAEVMENMRNLGVAKAPKWSTKEIEKAVNTLGWYELCTVEAKDLNIIRAQFKAIYNAVCERSKNATENKAIFNALSEPERKQIQKTDDLVKKLVDKSVK